MKNEAGISTNPTTWAGGQGNSNRGCGNSGRGGARGQGQGHEHQQASPKSPNFKGKTEELGGMIFELGEGTNQITSYNFSVKMSKRAARASPSASSTT
jgi:hypothetical protein